GRIDGGNEGVLPGAMQTTRHEIVHQVVARRYVGEDRVDLRLPLAGHACLEIKRSFLLACEHRDRPLCSDSTTIARSAQGRYLCAREGKPCRNCRKWRRCAAGLLRSWSMRAFARWSLIAATCAGRCPQILRSGCRGRP